MTQELRQLITDELTKMLNRVPTEQEIMNGQTDQYIMNRVMMRQLGLL